MVSFGELLPARLLFEVSIAQMADTVQLRWESHC